MKKVMVVFGTRPEAIKMAPVVKELQKHSDKIQTIVCTTGQHREMLDQVLSVFQIKPDVDLNLMRENQTLPSLTSNTITSFTDTIHEFKPDIVLVQGDTTTAMVVGLASFYEKIAVGHVEAGLRTNNRYSPFPEEINRRIISVLATYHFAPTQTAVDTLIAEGIPQSNVYLTGNTVIDALFIIINRNHELNLGFSLDGKKNILVTAHRRENLGLPLENICMALKQIAQRNPEVQIIYPVHLNPKVQTPVHAMLSGEERIHLLTPLEYESFVHLMNRCYLILTDSGGIQEEAPALGKPVLVLRRETERPEAVEAGAVKVVGTDIETIISETERLLYDKDEYARMSKAISPYGDGHAAERIVNIIMETHILRL